MSDVTTRFKTPRLRSKAHLHFVSHCGCVVPGCRHHRSLTYIVWRLVHLGISRPPQSPYVTWHHVRRASNSGTAVKPGDDETVGLCDMHHKAVHQAGEKTCADQWGIDLMELAQRLAAHSRAAGRLPP